MRTRIHLLAVALLASVASAAEPTSLAAIKDNYDKGDYRVALRGIAELLRSQEASVSNEVRYDLLVCKGECLLRLRERSYAVDAFEDAQRVAEDPRKAAAARAMAVLVRASRGPAYIPRAGGEGIDILAPESRRKAMIALMEDELARLRGSIDEALAGTSLLPMRQLLDPLSDAHALEVSGTGQDVRTRPILEKLGGHARELIEKELARLHRRIEQINVGANELVLMDVGLDELVRKGLDSDQRRELENVSDYLRQIGQAARAGREAALGLGAGGQKWEALIADADSVADRAAAIHDRRY